MKLGIFSFEDLNKILWGKNNSVTFLYSLEISKKLHDTLKLLL